MTIKLASIGDPKADGDYTWWPVEYDIDGERVSASFLYGGLRKRIDQIRETDEGLRSAVARHLFGVAIDHKYAKTGDVANLTLADLKESIEAITPKLVEVAHV